MVFENGAELVTGPGGGKDYIFDVTHKNGYGYQSTSVHVDLNTEEYIKVLNQMLESLGLEQRVVVQTIKKVELV